MLYKAHDFRPHFRVRIMSIDYIQDFMVSVKFEITTIKSTNLRTKW